MNKIDLIAFSQYKTGGVQTFYKHLLSYDTDFFNKKWILTKRESDTDPLPTSEILELPHDVLSIREGSAYRNARALKKLIPNYHSDGLILVNQPSELRFLSAIPPKNKTIFFFCHDEVYLDFAKRYESIIDVFIAHNIAFYSALKSMFPERTNNIFFLPFGIEKPKKYCNEKKEEVNKLTVIFLARLVKLKGVFDIPDIDDILISKGIDVNWKIIGNGPEKEKLKKQVDKRSNFMFCSPEYKKDLDRELAEGDIFVLPTYLDGTPLALLESMSVGLVPIVYKFNEGASHMIGEGNGFVVPVGDKEAIANSIITLNNNRSFLSKKSLSVRKHISENFDRQSRNKKYYELFSDYKKHWRPKKVNVKIYKSRLERLWLPYPIIQVLTYLKNLLYYLANK